MHKEFSDKQLLIMEAAEQLFAEKTYDSTSVRDIAKAASINIAMISYYFGSKEDLMKSLFGYRMQFMKNRLNELIEDKTISPLEKMEIIVTSWIDKIFAQQSFHKIMVHAQLNPHNSTIKNLMNTYKEEQIQQLEKIIKDGQKKKLFIKNIDIPFMISLNIGCISQFILNIDFYNIIYNTKTNKDKNLEKIKINFKSNLLQINRIFLHEANTTI
jgi:AcrR family transcriptional regulator